VDKKGCINWGLRGEDPWAFANDILNKMKNLVSKRDYFQVLEAAGIEVGKTSGFLVCDRVVGGGVGTGDKECSDRGESTFYDVWSQLGEGAASNMASPIEKMEKGIASAYYSQGSMGFSSSSTKARIGLNKNIFTDNGQYCVQDISELVSVIGHEFAHHFLNHLGTVSNRAKKQMQRLPQNEDGDPLFTNPDGSQSAVKIESISLMSEYQTNEHNADLLGCYLAENISGDYTCKIREWLTRNFPGPGPALCDTEDAWRYDQDNDKYYKCINGNWTLMDKDNNVADTNTKHLPHGFREGEGGIAPERGESDADD